MNYTLTGAVIRGKYRYMLFREWKAAQVRFKTPGRSAGMTLQRFVVFIGLNPSTADAHRDDATIRRCVGYASAWGYNGLIMLNLCAYRATDPKELTHVRDPVGKENDDYIECYVERADLVVACWGGNTFVHERASHVLKLLHRHGEVHCLLKTKWGAPAHPLRLPKCLKPIVYEKESA